MNSLNIEPSLQHRLWKELMLRCDTLDKKLSALVILAELWDRSTHYERSCSLLYALIEGVRRCEDKDWCCALLHMALYPRLQGFAQQHPWTKVRSSFGKAVEEYPLEKTNYVASRLGSMTEYFLEDEQRQARQQAKLESVVGALLDSYSLAEVLLGQAARFTKEEAEDAIDFFRAGRILFKKDVPIVMNRFFPSRRCQSSKQRKRNSRAFAKLKERIRSRLKGRCL
jgi:hypothetical protein